MKKQLSSRGCAVHLLDQLEGMLADSRQPTPTLFTDLGKAMVALTKNDEARHFLLNQHLKALEHSVAFRRFGTATAIVQNIFEEISQR